LTGWAAALVIHRFVWLHKFRLALIAWAFFTQHFSIIPICIFGFIAAHAVGQGAVIWVLFPRFFPTGIAPRARRSACFTHWVFAALLTTFFPKLVSAFPPGYVFSFFAGMMVLQLIWG